MKLSVAKSISGNEKGFTLVESLVAMAIFSVVMLATASMLFTGMSASVNGSSRFIAGSIAQGWVDDLMRRPYADVVNNPAPLIAQVDGRRFTTNWVINTIGTIPARPVLRRFSVTTGWTDKSGAHAVTITGLRAP